jgi:multiple sugar transport system substrate-binding protein
MNVQVAPEHLSTPTSGTPALFRSRRSLLRAGAMSAVLLLAAACSPTRALSPNTGARTNGSSGRIQPAEKPDDGAGTARPGESVLTPPSTSEPAARLTPSSPRTRPPALAPTPVPTRGTEPVPVSTASAQEAGAPGSRAYATLLGTAGTVQFLHGWDASTTPLIETMMADFGTLYPQIEVEAEELDPATLRDRLVTAIASGSPPNAVMLRSDSTAYFADQGALLPLDDLLARDGIRADWFVPRELPARTWNGRLYGLPNVAAGAEQLLYVNTGLLERLGVDPAAPIATWTILESLIEPARRIGALALDPTRCGAGVTGLQVWTYANGGRWLDDAAEQITWDDTPAVQAAEWLQKLVSAHRSGGPGLPPIADRPSASMLVTEWTAEKHVCCINDATWIYQLRQLAPQLSYAIYELPWNTLNASSDGRAPSYGGWMLAIPRDTADRSAAWEWLKYATASPAAQQLAETQGRPSPMMGRTGAPVPAGTSANSGAVKAATDRAVPTPAVPVSAQLDDLARAAQNEILAQQRPPQPILETAARAAQKMLDEWHARRRRP